MKNILILLCFLAISCDSKLGEEMEHASKSGYSIRPSEIRDVKLTDQFWLPLVQKVQEKTIDYAIQKCVDEGRLENFLIAGHKMEGKVRGAMPFDDTDIYKIIEGASNTLLSAPNPSLEMLLDSLIDIIAVGQEADGYLTTWRTIDPASPPAPWVAVKEGKRWESLGASHELYNAGHLYEAAAVHHKATGKNNFLNIALKNADLMVKTFGDDEGQIHNVPGHQIIETGLLQLFAVTTDSSYLHLAKYFLDSRGQEGHHELYGAYSQDHEPVTHQSEVVGHAVRAMYMYAAMTDIAAMLSDTSYKMAVDNLWENMVYKKMYITGGIGALHDGEAFGGNFELPNMTAYNETCAAIGSVYWNHRLFRMTGDAKYYDVIERTLYNALIAGLSLSGTEFFYPNPLESDGKYTFNRGACTRQGWFDCSCCPTNMIRFLPSVGGLIYGQEENTIYVNLLIGSEANVDVNGSKVHITQKGSYPLKGDSEIMVKNDGKEAVIIKVRIPYWAKNKPLPGDLYAYTNKVNEAGSLTVDGSNKPIDGNMDYIEISVPGQSSKEIKLEFAMEVRYDVCSDDVEENKGKTALEYGPFVYAFEEIDNASNWDKLKTAPNSIWEAKYNAGILGGVNTLSSGGLVAVPYYAWSNRGIGKMKVWIDNN